MDNLFPDLLFTSSSSEDEERVVRPCDMYEKRNDPFQTLNGLYFIKWYRLSKQSVSYLY